MHVGLPLESCTAFSISVKIDEGISRPELFPQFLASNDLAGMLKQCRKHLERLFLKPNPYTMFA